MGKGYGKPRAKLKGVAYRFEGGRKGERSGTRMGHREQRKGPLKKIDVKRMKGIAVGWGGGGKRGG